MRHALWTLAIALGLGAAAMPAHAEVAEVVLAQQFGATFLPMMAMEAEKLVEKHAAAKGVPGLKVVWAKLGGPAAVSDAMISGQAHFSLQGVPSMILLWDKTRNGLKVHAVSGNCSGNFWLNVRNPAIKSLKDLTETDRIAVPSAKVSMQAIILQMAAEREFGPGQFAKLEHLVVTLPNPDGMAAVLNTWRRSHFMRPRSRLA
jgi:NitT/TauT family transport system substrate-binding protein